MSLSASLLLSHELSGIRASGALPEAALRRLDLLFSGDGTLDRALELLEGSLTRVSGAPSGRAVWTVASSLSKRPSAELVSLDLRASGVDPVGYFYVVLLDGPGSCTCADWTTRVLGGDRRACKHALAVAIADALGPQKYRARAVTDDDLAKLLRNSFAALQK